MTHAAPPVAPVSIIILGAGGDLTRRLLLPGLANLLAHHPRRVQILGASTEDLSHERWQRLIRSCCRTILDPDTVDDLVTQASYFRVDVTTTRDLERLLSGCNHPPVIYFALPPEVTARSCHALAQMPLPDGTRLALEKPFGVDRASAQALNVLLDGLVPERQVFRIDHFLGMSTVLNILGLRFANPFLDEVWDADHIERVDIVYDEALGLEGRGGYYDHAGALKDMIQSHLLQVMALVAMERPQQLHEHELRSQIAGTLRATRLYAHGLETSTRRARYTAGSIDGRMMRSYVDEPDVDPSRDTETLAQIIVEIDTPRFRGVPFLLRSGKAVGHSRAEVRVQMKPVPPLPGFIGTPPPDEVILDLRSGEIRMNLTTNGSDGLALEQSALVARRTHTTLLPYGQVLRGILDNDALLSVRGDVAEECWRIVESVLDAWRNNEVPLDHYAAGSAGPATWRRSQ